MSRLLGEGELTEPINFACFHETVVEALREHQLKAIWEEPVWDEGAELEYLGLDALQVTGIFRCT